MKSTPSIPQPKSNLFGSSLTLVIAVLFGASPLMAHYNETTDDGKGPKEPHQGASATSVMITAVASPVRRPMKAR